MRALEYAPERVALAHVVSPPHDVLTERQIKALRAASAHNIVHLTLPEGKVSKKDPDPYAPLAETLAKWQQEGYLRLQGEEAIYAYECQYAVRGEPRRLRGTVAALRLDPTYRTVVP